jgi:drug/metabolite transporter (DMT)-like permease
MGCDRISWSVWRCARVLSWTFALERTTPTRVAIAITLNPLTAGAFGVFALGEPITWNLIAGLLLVLTGIWLAASHSAGSPIKVPTSSDH